MTDANHRILPPTTSDSITSWAQSQFEGCLLGGLVGDCFGFPFENEVDQSPSSIKVQKYFEHLKWVKVHENEKRLIFTDDSSMTRTLAKFCLHLSSSSSSMGDPEAINWKELAEAFTNAFFLEKCDRGYGNHVQRVFTKLSATDFENPFLPASHQFNGQGSRGNGAAMRVSPLVLLTIEQTDPTILIDLVVLSSMLTHTHPEGIIGAIFQALAIRRAILFKEDEDPQFNQIMDVTPIQFKILRAFQNDFSQISANHLSKFCRFHKPLENVVEIDSILWAYRDKLKVMESFLQLKTDRKMFPGVSQIKNNLGVKVTALDSVPTALYCFLASFDPVPMVRTENQFQRTIQLAICCGGDTDTIASMAGALAGSYLGSQIIHLQFRRRCEDEPEFLELARQLFKQCVSPQFVLTRGEERVVKWKKENRQNVGKLALVAFMNLF